MNGKWMPLLLAVALVVGFPRLVFGIWTITYNKGDPQNEPTVSTKPEEIVSIQVLTENGLREMDIEEYLVGVLLMEIPGDFHIEAQKAQAVVARTYALRTTQFKEKHDANAICTDPACCQGYRDPGKYLSMGGTAERIGLARMAVAETKNQILTYDGVLIDATYFSCSGGQTEDAVAVWGVDIPYLQSVDSPGEENASHYWDTKEFTVQAFQESLGQILLGSPKQWFGETTYTRGGGVKTMVIGGRLYTGTSLRKLLNLRSTAFSVTVTNSSIVITTRGFGHRVGMSQYGAQSMASAGKYYSDILLHYYPGTEIDKVDFIG